MRTQSQKGYLLEACENTGDQVGIGFTFASNWFRWWHKFSKPITEQNKAKPMQPRITLNTQLKTALQAKDICSVSTR